MPPPLAVDREQAKMMALTYGVREAARMMGIKEGTMVQWSKRDNWFPEPVKQVLPPTMTPVLPVNEQGVISVIKPSEAIQNALEDQSKRSKIAFSKAAMKAAEHVAELHPDEILEKARSIKELSAVAALTGNWQSQEAGVTLNILSQINIGELNEFNGE